MTLPDIAHQRLANQQIVNSDFMNPQDIVAWMGAMQAQDFEMSKWAVGIRTPGITEEGVQNALDNGDILRTHVLRPTWHLVSKEDISWMIDLTAPHIKTTIRSTWKQRGLDEALFNKCNKLITKAIEQRGHLTRNEIKELMHEANIDTGNNRLSHILIVAELEKLICSGIKKGKQQTYALFEERVPTAKNLSKEEALAKLAGRYFKSHGPATLKDFTWWSGLPVTHAKQALELAKVDLVLETIESQEYWFHESDSPLKHADENVHLIPAYDEFIISYADRSAVLNSDQHKKVISNNGMFWPVIVADGKVIGMWKRTIKKDKVIVEPELFTSQKKKITDLIDYASEYFGEFLDLKPHVVKK